MLNRRTVMVATLGTAVAAAPARAALEVGERAPDFTTMAALAGKAFSFTLHAALRQGPVVLYFFPAAFSEGCSLEARSFAAATDQYQALGATVVGVSGDDLDTLKRFSVKSCNGKFAVASDETQAIMKAYDAVLQSRPDYAARVSYVLGPNATVLFVYNNLNPDKHVDKTLAALREWRARPAAERRG
jgi:thioredoxin-dependent peroxiredoxin